MDEEYRPLLKSYDQWCATWDDCKCDACYVYHHVDDRLGVSLAISGPEWKLDKHIRDSIKNYRMSDCPLVAHLPKRRHHKGNGKLKGMWAGTLTMSPTDPYNECDMVDAVRKLFSQKTSPVEKYAWYLEYTENGLPHIHFCYQRADGSRILRKVFTRIWPIWDEDTPVGRGHRGGYHNICARPDDYLKYIAKDKGRHEEKWPES